MSLWIILLSLLAGALGIFYYLSREPEIFKRCGIPYIRPIAFFGNVAPVLFQRVSFTEFLEKLYNLHPEAKYVGMFDLTTPIVIVRDLELVKSIAVEHFAHFPDHRNIFKEDIEPLFSKNLVALQGQRWKDMRSLLSPAFTSSKMKAMFKLMSECAVNFAEYWQNAPIEIGNCVDARDAFTRYTNDVIATCAFGIKVDSLKDRENEFYMFGKGLTSNSTLRLIKVMIAIYCPWIAKLTGMGILEKNTRDFFTEVIDSAIRTRDEKGISRPDMIQLMMESRGKKGIKELTIEDMTSQALIFFLGGFDTVATLLCFAAHEIAANPDIQNKLQTEIDRVVENTNGDFTYDALNEMTYLDAVIEETLRMWPATPFTDRMCVKNFELPPTLPDAKSFTVKAGSSVWFPIHSIQRDSKYFDEPNSFLPDRFLMGDKRQASTTTFLPFGIGPRMCIGNRFALMETKILLFHLLLRCDLKPSEKTPLTIKLGKSSLMAPEEGFWLKIQPRSSRS